MKTLKNYIYFWIIFFLKLQKKILNFYENFFAGFLSKYFFFIYKIPEIFLKRNNIYLIRPMPKGPGEFLISLDYFVRRLENYKKFKKKKFIIINKNEINFSILKNDNIYFYKIINNNFIYYLLLPLLLKNDNLNLDIGIGTTKWNIKNFPNEKFNNFPYYHKRPFSKVFNAYLKYQKIYFKKNLIGFPFNAHKIDSKLKDKINFSKKIVLIHSKNEIRNSCCMPTDPNTFLPLLKYLKKKDYFVVHIGRDKMFDLFKKYVDFDYANSNYISLNNDLSLSKISFTGIYNASGAYTLSAVINKPFLHLNSWHNFNVPSLSKNYAIDVPALINHKDKKLTFKEQKKYCENIFIANKGHTLNDTNYQCVNAGKLEILNGFIELENLILKKSFSTNEILQTKINSLIYSKDNLFPLYKTNSQISEYFLKSHIDRF
jgi:hypothetical protein